MTQLRLPLEGIRVLDLTRVLAGPWTTMSLGDLGAEVWKIENIKGGDDTRAWSALHGDLRPSISVRQSRQAEHRARHEKP